MQREACVPCAFCDHTTYVVSRTDGTGGRSDSTRPGGLRLDALDGRRDHATSTTRGRHARPRLLVYPPPVARIEILRTGPGYAILYLRHASITDAPVVEAG